MADMNVCCFTGRLGGDAESRDINGKTKSRYRVAIGGRNDQTTWLTCEHWECPAGLLALLTKGQRVAFTGRIEEQKWTGKDGAEKSAFVCTVQSVQIMSPPPPKAAAPAKPAATKALPKFEEDDGGIPF
jgi:single-stranded DNA-binding protein